MKNDLDKQIGLIGEYLKDNYSRLYPLLKKNLSFLRK